MPEVKPPEVKKPEVKTEVKAPEKAFVKPDNHFVSKEHLVDFQIAAHDAEWDAKEAAFKQKMKDMAKETAAEHVK